MGYTDPITKLIEVVASAIGVKYEPKRIINNSKAEAHRLIELKKAELVGLEMEEEFKERMARRIVHKEVQRQHNIDTISRIAIEETDEEGSVTDEKVDEDWINRFFKYAEDVSNEEMQKMWGKILAGEVKRPNTYSLRTLEFIKNLSHKEAELIFKCFTLAIGSKENVAQFIYNGRGVRDKDYFLAIEEELLLNELGIINVNPKINLAVVNFESAKVIHFISKRYTYAVQIERETIPKVPVIAITKLGRELYSLNNNIDINPNYFKDYLSDFKKDELYFEKYEPLYLRAELNGDFEQGTRYNYKRFEYKNEYVF